MMILDSGLLYFLGHPVYR